MESSESMPWRQIVVSVLLCCHPQGPQVNQPVTGQTHTKLGRKGSCSDGLSSEAEV